MSICLSNLSEILGIVSESGANKSTISIAIMQLIDYHGYIRKGFHKALKYQFDWNVEDEVIASGARKSVLFSGSINAADPVLTIGFQLMGSIRLHRGLSGEELNKAVELLTQELAYQTPSTRLNNTLIKLEEQMQEVAYVPFIFGR